MKLSQNQSAPLFNTVDIWQNTVSLQHQQGHKIYLAFMRNAGCPVCNLRVHELLQKADHFAKHNIKIWLVYESTQAKMKEYLSQQSYPFTFIADPENKLYKLYSVERSTGKVLKSLFNGILGKAMKGQKLYKEKISQDGHTNTIPAEFLIDEKGRLQIVHYGTHIGDHLPIEQLR
ncbi:peroxiredoxin-like family protein [Cytophagaceae bacterium YF14B1]|uniref:Peroxiredoxin-like family protein n=1 Tax=Xanthocytophaga flava TaxID=3048013 RepID=A0AAE3QUX7_9BACT|nr:peroxiredoxin-like family protein [Xanthocytophaga flavus]MDJ1483761.1 peroxiredoxin-like family protein [Xanthocytophaga flavus]